MRPPAMYSSIALGKRKIGMNYGSLAVIDWILEGYWAPRKESGLLVGGLYGLGVSDNSL